MRVILFSFFFAFLLTTNIAQSQETESPPDTLAMMKTKTPAPVRPFYYSKTPAVVPLVAAAETPTTTPIYIQTTISKETPVETPAETPLSEENNKRLIRKYTSGTYGDSEDPGLISDVAFSPDGKSIYTACLLKQVICWDKETGTIQKKYAFEIDYIYRMQLTNDGKKITVSGQTNTHSTIRDTVTGNILFNKVLDNLPSDFYLYDNGNKCIFNTYNEFYLWDIQKDSLIYKQSIEEGFSIPNIFVSPQEKYCIILYHNNYGSYENYFNVDQSALWNIENQKTEYFFDVYPRIIFDAHWMPDGKLVWFLSRRQNGSSYDKLYIDLYNIETRDHLFQREIPNPNMLRFTKLSSNGDKFLICLDKIVEIYDTLTGAFLVELPHLNDVTSAKFSQDGKTVLTGTTNRNGTAAAYLWDISDLGISPIPSLTPCTPTPTATPTFTPTPNQPVAMDTNYKIEPIAHSNTCIDNNSHEGGIIVIDSKTKELILARRHQNSDYQNFIFIYKFPMPSEYTSFNMDTTPYRSYPVMSPNFRTIFPCDDGTILVPASDYLMILRPNGSSQSIQIKPGNITQSIHVVTAASHIPDTKPGDILILMESWKNDYSIGSRIDKLDLTEITKGFTPLIDNSSIPDYFKIVDFTEGPGGYLYFLSTDSRMIAYSDPTEYCPTKILYWNENREFKEWSHFSINDLGQMFVPQYNFLHYAQQEGVFYLTTTKNQDNYNTHLLRISNSSNPIQSIAISKPYLTFLNSPSNSIYVMVRGVDDDSTVSEIVPLNPIIPTPTPSEPTPTPTPIAGWFVLDGFGGIHSTNKDIPSPVLPYWIDFNIVRDIEPDPLGRGWYMLDGFGGIHTSSPDLPKPDTLPYFCFDIARRLKVKDVNGKLEFYLLDGYGVIHSTDPNFDESKIIWFNDDRARDLRLGQKENEWIVMDSYGTLYFSKDSTIDIIRYTHPYLISPIMRSFVRFPDETTVMLDLSGGRHTNQYFPANDVVKGLSPDFYFPGWDIVWDLEVIPENMAKRGN